MKVEIGNLRFKNATERIWVPHSHWGLPTEGEFYGWGLDFNDDGTGGTYTVVLISFPELNIIRNFHPNVCRFPEGFPPPPVTVPELQAP
jgi:hypothetical protein